MGTTPVMLWLSAIAVIVSPSQPAVQQGNPEAQKKKRRRKIVLGWDGADQMSMTNDATIHSTAAVGPAISGLIGVGVASLRMEYIHI